MFKLNNPEVQGKTNCKTKSFGYFMYLNIRETDLIKSITEKHY